MSRSLTPEQVLRRHLELAAQDPEEDVLQSYREDSFLIAYGRVYRGKDAIRACVRRLQQELPNARFRYEVVVVEGDVGFLKWSADSDLHTVRDGVDSYVIEAGAIRAQTIHYTLVPAWTAG